MALFGGPQVIHSSGAEVHSEAEGAGAEVRSASAGAGAEVRSATEGAVAGVCRETEGSGVEVRCRIDSAGAYLGRGTQSEERLSTKVRRAQEGSVRIYAV